MLRAYKYRLYPNKEQKIYLAKTFGCTRLIYNLMLSDRMDTYDKYKDNKEELKKQRFPTPAQYKSQYEFLKEVDSLALANAQLNLDMAYKNFFRDKSVGFPKFKTNRRKPSYSYRRFENI